MYGPLPFCIGTHDGTRITLLVCGCTHSTSFNESQPQPRPTVPAVPAVGFRPGFSANPSGVADTSVSWPSQLGAATVSKVRSEIA